MALTEAIADGQVRVETLREELGKVRHALDNTDAVLGVADEGLIIAEDVIQEARKVMPVLITITLVATAAAMAVYLIRKRKDREQEPQSA